MEIYYDKNNEKLKIKFSGKAKDLLKKLKINPESVIIVDDTTKDIILEKDIIKNTQKIKILSVVSGG